MRNRSSSVLTVLTALGAAAFGQTPAATEQPARVSGIVTNSVTGEPIVRAHVSLGITANRPRSMQTLVDYGAMTDGEGKFSITSVPPAIYVVSAERVGYAQPSFGRPVDIKPGDQKDDLKLQLIPDGAITGRVLDDNGDPVEGVQVAVDIGGIQNGPGATTDDKGQFRIGGLRPGKYRLKASQQNQQFPPEIRTDGTSEIHYASTYYPSSVTEKGAAKITVAPGSELNDIDIRLVRTPLVRVRGTVVSLPNGNENLSVMTARGMFSNGGRGWRVKPDGTFELWHLDPGRYTLYARQFSNGQNLQTAPVEIEVAGSNIDHVELRIVPAFDVSGVVQFEDEQAKPPAQRQSQPAPGQVLLRELDGIGTFGNQGPGTIAADGSFTFHQLAAGRYLVELNWGNAYVKSVQLGPVQMNGRTLDLRLGAGGAPVTVVVSSAVAELSGSVRNGDDPAPGKTVVLAPNPNDTGRPYTAMSRLDGIYKLGSISPGNYKLVLVDDNDMGAMNGKSLDDYDDALEITISPGDKLTKDLKVRTDGK